MSEPSTRSPEEVRAQPDRGRRANTPSQIPWKGWLQVAKRVVHELGDDRAGLMAAGVAFYGLLSLIPSLVVVVSVYGLLADPALVAAQLDSMEGFLPASAQEVISTELNRLVDASPASLNLSLLLSLGLALWTANYATLALMSACTAAYEEREERGWIRLYGQAFLLTLAGLLFVIVALGAVAGLPAIFAALDLRGEAWASVTSLVRWPLLLGGLLLALAVLYRYGTSRSNPRWQWVSVGSVTAALCWVVVSLGFSAYVSRFGDFNRTYGSLGAVAVLLLWMWLSAYLVILGAEINAELEHETLEDTTDPPEEALGERGAFVADTYAD